MLNAIALLPHKEPVLCVDEILQADKSFIQARYCVSERNSFVIGNVFTEAGMIECMAQTVAAGLMQTNDGSGEISTANKFYLAAITNANFEGNAFVGNEIKIDVVVEHVVLNFILVKAKVSLNTKQLAEATLKLAFY